MFDDLVVLTGVREHVTGLSGWCACVIGYILALLNNAVFQARNLLTECITVEYMLTYTDACVYTY